MIPELIYKIIYLVFYVGAAIIKSPYAHKAKKMKIKFSRGNVKEYSLAAIMGILLMLPPLIYIFSSWINRFNLIFPDWLRIIGTIGFIGAIVFYGWTHITLKTNWFPVLEIKEKQQLITSGPYKRIRHPMYTSTLFWAVFQGLVLPNSLIIIAGMLGFIIFYSGRVGDEEKLMLKQFGKKYQDYMKKTGRIFPKLKK
ncbi:MAG: isoprenylcysteine carboxylmethyltransferase family protein [Nanoarchaeota archaeon]|nr:isoprenylcysteine carboxylmethyltransferase family protein [Nanoarchaeota archaeon]MBU1622909.1 isoprenylcysteine carboxylmethyltransferase family protein [Nanoarchaeota archaeon]